jgi:hypothetical protein
MKQWLVEKRARGLAGVSQLREEPGHGPRLDAQEMEGHRHVYGNAY